MNRDSGPNSSQTLPKRLVHSAKYLVFPRQHEAAGAIEAVFVAGGLRTEHAFGRFRAAGFRTVDPGGFGAVQFWGVR